METSQWWWRECYAPTEGAIPTKTSWGEGWQLPQRETTDWWSNTELQTLEHFWVKEDNSTQIEHLDSYISQDLVEIYFLCATFSVFPSNLKTYYETSKHTSLLSKYVQRVSHLMLDLLPNTASLVRGQWEMRMLPVEDKNVFRWLIHLRGEG